MKNKLYIFAAVAGIMSLSSCSDFLDQKNSYQASEVTFSPRYNHFTENSLSPGLEDAWGAFYSVIAQSNNVINNIQSKCGASVSEKAKVQGMAEARFMRGLAYWYVGSVWGKGII